MTRNCQKGQLIAQMGYWLSCWWYAWRSGGVSRLLLRQAGYLVWYLANGQRRYGRPADCPSKKYSSVRVTDRRAASSALMSP